MALILIAVSACCAFAGCSENSENSENTTSAVTEATTEETTIAPTTEEEKDPNAAAPIQKIEAIKQKAEYDSEKETIHITVENHTEADVLNESTSFNYYKLSGEEPIFQKTNSLFKVNLITTKMLNLCK